MRVPRRIIAVQRSEGSGASFIVSIITIIALTVKGSLKIVPKPLGGIELPVPNTSVKKEKTVAEQGKGYIGG
jgi:hypothetical protein